MRRASTRYASFATVVICLTSVVACRNEPAPRRAGPARRVVALAPNLAEIIVDFGGGEQLVGVSSYGTLPESMSKVQRVGGFTDPSIERIIELQPDLVIGVPIQNRALQSARDANLPVLEVECQTVAQVLVAYETLGKAFGRVERAVEVRDRLSQRLKQVRKNAEGRRRPRTLFLLGLAGRDLQQVYPVGPGNFGHELLELAGGQNVLDNDIPSINAEAVITLAPEVIIEVSMDDVGQEERALPPSPLWARLPSIPATRNGRVHALASTTLLVPGPRIADGAELLFRLLQRGGETGGVGVATDSRP